MLKNFKLKVNFFQKLVPTAYSIHRAPHGARGLTVLDDETRCWLNNTTASI